MKVLFDTSVLVAALDAAHADHARAAAAWARVKSGAVDAVVSAHAVAEVYNTLTKGSRTNAVSAARTVAEIHLEILPYCTVVALSAAEYVALPADVAARGLFGGIVYDAIHARVAERTGCDQLCTFNLKHFRRVWAGPPSAVVAP